MSFLSCNPSCNIVDFLRNINILQRIAWFHALYLIQQNLVHLLIIYSKIPHSDGRRWMTESFTEYFRWGTILCSLDISKGLAVLFMNPLDIENKSLVFNISHTLAALLPCVIAAPAHLLHSIYGAVLSMNWYFIKGVLKDGQRLF